jgi:hypothetical protein
MKPSDFIKAVKSAIRESSQEDGGVPTPESLLAHLTANGLLVVEIPPGVRTDFVGLPHRA